MENLSKENKAGKNPQPNDQVQLEIETVTPETEKDVVPTQQSEKTENNNKSQDHVANSNQADGNIGTDDDQVVNDNKEDQEEGSSEQKLPTENKSDNKESAEKDADAENDEDGKDKKQEGSATDPVSDQIETVTP